MTTIVVFGSSLVLSFAIFVMKKLEISQNNENFVLKKIRKLDPYAEKLIATLKFRLLQAIQSIRYIVVVHIPAIISRHAEKLKEDALKEYRARHERLMGRKDISNKGAVSFFLKKIDENKRNGDKGEIL